MKKYKVLTGASVWKADDLKNNSDWIWDLNNTEKNNLKQEITQLNIRNYLELNDSTVKKISLLDHMSERILNELEYGSGIFLIRGVDPTALDLNQNKIFLYLLGLSLGIPVSQSIHGETLHCVESLNYNKEDVRFRGTKSSEELCWHNDPCDVAVLMCMRKAKEGGATKIVSSGAIHNKLLEDYPHLLRKLYEPYIYMPHNIYENFKEKYYRRPVFSMEKGVFVCNIARKFIDLAKENTDIPKMPDIYYEALDKFDEIANLDELNVTFFLEPGDILFINNYVVLHKRTMFTDYNEADKRRLLLRLWVSVANSRPLPESYRIIYGSVEPGSKRGGITPSLGTGL